MEKYISAFSTNLCQMKISIERADISCLDTIAGFQVQMARETENLHLDLPTVLKGVRHIFQNPGTGHYKIALHEGKIVASLLVLYEWSDWRNGNVLWIHSVYVLPQYRGKGIFSQMYAQLKEEVLQTSALIGLRLYVDKTNGSARNVYRKLGMTDQHYDLFEWMP